MQEQAKSAIVSSAPWRRGVPWPIVALEGVILLGIGIYIVGWPDSAQDVVRQLIAVVLLINGTLEALSGLRNPSNKLSPFRCLRGGVAMTIGFLVALESVSDYLPASSARTILAVGLLAYGLLGLVGVVARREDEGIRIGPLIGAVMCIILSILFFTGNPEDSSRLRTIGVVGIIFGVALLAFAFYLYRHPPAPAAEDSVVAAAPDAAA